jgi:sortase A
MTSTAPTPHRPDLHPRAARGARPRPLPAGTADGRDPARPEHRDGEPAAGRPAPSRAPRRVAVAGTALTILGALLLGFALAVSVAGRLAHARDQRVAYARLRADLANGTAPLGQTDVDGALLAAGRPVALLAIPALHLREVVLEGTTSRVLASGPGHRRDTPLPGQAGTSVVMGRAAAYGGPFGRVAALPRGTRLTVTTGQGTFAYAVTGTRRAGDPVPPLPAGAGRLTLVTASGPAYVPSGVVRVDAALVGKPQPAPPAVLGAGSLLASERPFAGDRAALVPLVLWSQALLLAGLAFTWARARWGRRQAWLAGVPVLVALGLAVAGATARLLPNLL